MTQKKTLKVKLVGSLIGRKPDHKATAYGLKLKRRDQTVEVEDTPAIRGMINKISYLLAVEEV